MGDSHPIPLRRWKAIKVTVGTGKTSRTVEFAKSAIREARGSGLPFRMLIVVPNHRLSNELFHLFNEDGDVRAEVWRGREQCEPETNEPMCRDLARVRQAVTLGVPVEQAACSVRAMHADGTRREIRCLHYDECRYQRQKAECARADVVIASHESLWHAPPKNVCKGFVYLIIDESFWQSGVAQPAVVTVDDLEPSTVGAILNGEATDNVARDQLRGYRECLSRLLRAHPEGPIRRAAALDAGITPEICSTAIHLEWMRKADSGIRPDMSLEECRRSAEAAGDRTPSVIGRIAAIWEALGALVSDSGPERSGRLTRLSNANGTGVISVRGMRHVAKELHCLRTLVLDATLDEEIVKQWFPDLQVVFDGDATMAHQRVRRVVDRTFGKSAVLHRPGLKPDECRRRGRNAEGVAEYIDFRAGQYGRLLVVTYKDLRERLEKRGLPSNVDIDHFNNLRGLDVYRDVDCIVVIGRPQPPSTEVEAMAGALTGSAVEPAAGYDRQGKHPDPFTDRLRWQICEAEVLQVIGRGRGVNRTADNPLQVDLLTNVQLPLEVHERFRWKQLEVNKVDRMALAGVVLLSPGDAAKAYPDIFKNVAAARYALRVISSENPYEYIFIGKLTLNHPVEVVYRPEPGGRGQQSRKAIFDPDRVPDPKGWLVEHLGNVAISETVVFRGVV
ncbi:hypothetical protein [Minwuia sp. IMCC3009]|uniref:hypothetical protein n=1 Tax=Minwuia sp. IMCC3009 TaxID=3040674 RepID=UPI0024791951|nr:hypothetical protein [Minwuia sp. IMCC3009]